MTVMVAELETPSVIAVIVALPRATARTDPFVATVATAGFELVQVKVYPGCGTPVELSAAA
jgi:hypothetical protein